MENEKIHVTTSGGIGFTGLLTIAFIVLKLCNVINWSWWWVLSPIWISVGLFVGVLAIVFLFFVVVLITAAIDEARENRKRKKKEKNND